MVNSGGEWRECGIFIHFRRQIRRGESYLTRVGEFICSWANTIIQSTDEGALIIPSKFRELLGEEFVLTKGLDGCLSIYPMDEWNAFEEKLRALPLTNKNARTFTRFFVAGATNCELDKQGRILVPQTLREFAGLEKRRCAQPETSTELRYGAKRSGARIVIMMIWTVLQRVCRTWVSSSKHYAGKKSNRRRIWNLNTNLYYWKKPSMV